jgi:two-component system cell cycle sensor histidine kinase/response regulator CckA
LANNKVTYRQHLREILFGIPPDVPHRLHRYVIVSNFMYAFALVGHSAFIPIYWILGAPLPLLLNTLFVPMDVLCLYLNQLRRYKTAFGIWVGVVTLHTVLSSLSYGWSSGFHYYILSLTAFIFIAPWKKSINIVLVGVITSIYLWLNHSGAIAPPTIELSPGLNRAVRIINMAVNFAALSYLANYFTLAAERTQAALEDREKTLQTILAASPVGIALVKSRKIYWANDALARLTGYDSHLEMDRDALRFFPNENLLTHFEHLAHDLGQPTIDLADTQIFNKDGAPIPCHIKIRPIVPKDKSQGSIVVVVDITDQKKAALEQEALLKKFQRAEKMEAVGTMAGGVAHDLNNILSGILSYPELLLLNIAPADPMRKPLEVIKQCGEKAAAVVQDLLTLTRRGVSVKQSIDLNHALAEYLDSPEHASLKRRHPGVRFVASYSTTPLTIAGSPIHLHKTIMNLMVNACEAMPEGGLVRVAAGNRILENAYMGYELIAPGAYAVLSVVDQGMGISQENLERIFEPFYTKKVMGRSGTGLGLAVVWGTLKDSGGFVDLFSQPGQGTRFELFFPSAPAPAPAAAHPPSHDAYRGSGEHVLVVDDQEEQRLVAASMLQALGYQVNALAGGEEAVVWLRNNRSDLLLIDMIMAPGIDGLETYRRVLDLRPNQRAVIASGYSETKHLTEALALGKTQYLKKPYTLLELAQAVRMTLAG